VAEAEGIHEPGEAGDCAQRGELGIAALDRQCLLLESDDSSVKRVRPRDRPAEVRKVVALARVDNDAVRNVVDAQAHRAVGPPPGDLEAQHVGSERQPFLCLWGAEADVAE